MTQKNTWGDSRLRMDDFCQNSSPSNFLFFGGNNFHTFLRERKPDSGHSRPRKKDETEKMPFRHQGPYSPIGIAALKENSFMTSNSAVNSSNSTFLRFLRRCRFQSREEETKKDIGLCF